MPPSLPMPRIMYGTAWKKDYTSELVIQAVKAGFCGIDTAAQPKHYREDLVGKAIQTLLTKGIVKREELFIQTKHASLFPPTSVLDGQDLTKPIPYDPKAPLVEQVKQSVQSSLKNLGIDYIDSVILHSPLRTIDDTLKAYTVLESFVETGQIRQLGISNIYDAKQLEHIIRQVDVAVSVVQNRWYEGNAWDWEVYDVCQKYGVQYQSFWTLTGSPTLLGDPYVSGMARKYGVTTSQLMFKLCQLWNITPLSGTTSPDHAREAIAAEEAKIEKDAEDVVKLWDALHGISR
ncbi:hypothetical protein I350_02554 [Cryptococcus amylolentus CBS 6273]|uniref:NADP-dependent oxidoreductase domain-containing protein n=1 Tax=Cryptococcus amylolentus CBS 6273 TaxID=1296118 RepID=A0A1E3KBC2_9TREE|nr:hypothetical protein I350_02554 [Cryptococcus amylolentus CBS 6273]